MYTNMENQEAKQLITESQNIYLITSKEPEAVASTLALFYTLKELGKNVNLLMDELPASLGFLAPSLDFISYPKNFVISIPSNVAQISQIYYEKNDDALKIHLTLQEGNIKKDNISFYFSETKPNLVITVGIKDFVKELPTKLDSFGFLLDSPILNIDNFVPMSTTEVGTSRILDQQVGTNNKKFGKINLVEEESLAEIINGLVDAKNKQTSRCLLTSLIVYTGNFKENPTAEVFQLASELMKKGADIKEITENLKI